MRCSVIAVVAVVLVACGSHAHNEQPPAAPATAKRVDLPEAPPLLTPGERMSYRVSLREIELAAFEIGIGEVQQLDGRKVIVVQSHARAVGFAHVFSKIDDRFTSWIDARNGRPVRFQSDEAESSRSTRIEHTTVEFAKRTEDMIPVTVALDDAPPRQQTQKVNNRDVWDFNSVLIALRGWEGGPGSSTSIEAFRSLYVWNLDVRIVGKETVITELGEYPALRFDAHSYRLDRQGQRSSQTPRQFSLWVSDDDGRVPLKVRAVTDFGEIVLELVDYDPGSGQRVR